MLPGMGSKSKTCGVVYMLDCQTENRHPEQSHPDIDCYLNTGLIPPMCKITTTPLLVRVLLLWIRTTNIFISGPTCGPSLFRTQKI